MRMCVDDVHGLGNLSLAVLRRSYPSQFFREENRSESECHASNHVNARCDAHFSFGAAFVEYPPLLRGKSHLLTTEGERVPNEE
jgi:hypothetical protein